MTEEKLEALLYEEEGTCLDFKSEQYSFEGASADEKGELLKDILAFTNAWKRTDAYILIGVEETRGGRSNIVGIEEHLDDHNLQEFVNSKTQRPVAFSYSALPFEGKQVGIIQIPVQERPFYIKRDFGRLKKQTVYIRRGSSTGIAEPDEIKLMGVEVPITTVPQLDVQFADSELRQFLGKEIVLKTTLFKIPPEKDIPNYAAHAGRYGSEAFVNRDYYRQAARFMHEYNRVKSVRLALTNTGITTARGTRVELFIACDPSKVFITDDSNLPERPVRETLGARILSTRSLIQSDLHVEQITEGWRVEVEFGKSQSKQTKLNNDKIYIGSMESQALRIGAKIFADELPNPIELELIVSTDVECNDLPVEAILSL